MKFVCIIVDVKVGYGKPRFKITPRSGTGETWVEFTSISPMPQDTELFRAKPTPLTRTVPVPSVIDFNKQVVKQVTAGVSACTVRGVASPFQK